MQNLNPFLLAATTPEPDPRLLPLLRSTPTLASQQDSHGYSLLHAATSYNHISLLRSLITEFNVDINLKDEDGETCLFVAETLEVAKCLVEELHININIRSNEDDLTAAERIEADEDYPDVAEYLRGRTSTLLQNGARNGDGQVLTTDDALPHPSSSSSSSLTSNSMTHPPPLPPNMNININTVTEDQLGLAEQVPDPEFRRRIEELAAKENFNTEQGQQELRDLITDAVRGVGGGEQQREVRRRTD